MADTTEGRIVSALTSHLEDLTLDPDLPVAWPNVSFTAPASGKYLRCQHLPNETSIASIGRTGLNLHQGIFQVTVVWPQDVGEIVPKEVAGEIIAHFKRGTVIVNGGLSIRITEPPWPAPALVEASRYEIPVSIRYRVYADNPS